MQIAEEVKRFSTYTDLRSVVIFGGIGPKTQKEQIKVLRQRGMGYIRVAQALGISENTVKSFCRRNKLTGQVKQEKLAEHFCFYCGTAVTQNPGRKEKKFCSNKCRMKWWNAHFDKLNKKTMYPYTCPHCSKAFPRSFRRLCLRKIQFFCQRPRAVG